MAKDVEKVNAPSSEVETVAKETDVESQEITDPRHFQKTRSFSVVEKSPEDKPSAECSNVPTEFPPREIAHSHSEQLESQNKKTRGNDDKTPTSPAQKPLSLIGSKDSEEKPTNEGGGTLIMQFDYLSGDQPMSLQNDPSFSRAAERFGDKSTLRKSGHDLSEMEVELTRHRFEKSRAYRMDSRPRLEILHSPLTYSPKH